MPRRFVGTLGRPEKERREDQREKGAYWGGVTAHRNCSAVCNLTNTDEPGCPMLHSSVVSVKRKMNEGISAQFRGKGGGTGTWRQQIAQS